MFIITKTLNIVKKKNAKLLALRFSVGAENGVRTRDPQLGKLMLYQLSYFRLYIPYGYLLTAIQFL
jgi:hypothetical protein